MATVARLTSLNRPQSSELVTQCCHTFWPRGTESLRHWDRPHMLARDRLARHVVRFLRLRRGLLHASAELECQYARSITYSRLLRLRVGRGPPVQKISSVPCRCGDSVKNRDRSMRPTHTETRDIHENCGSLSSPRPRSLCWSRVRGRDRQVLLAYSEWPCGRPRRPGVS